MTWPTTTFEDFLSGEGAKVLGRDLWDRDEVIGGKRMTYAFGNISTALAFPQNFSQIRFRFPSFVETIDTLKLDIFAGVGGGATGQVRLDFNGTTGATVNITGATNAWYTVELAITAGWIPSSPSDDSTIGDLHLDAGISSGAGTLTIDARLTPGNLYFLAG